MSGSYYNPLCARTVIMKFVTWDRRVATSASLAVLCAVLLFVICTFHAASLAAQSSPDQADSPGAQEKQARKLATQTKTITGCLQKGYESDEFSITADMARSGVCVAARLSLTGTSGKR